MFIPAVKIINTYLLQNPGAVNEIFLVTAAAVSSAVVTPRGGVVAEGAIMWIDEDNWELDGNWMIKSFQSLKILTDV